MNYRSYLVIIFLFCLFATPTNGSDGADSLRELVASSNGMIKADTYIKLIDHYFYLDIDSVLYFSEKLYSLSDSLDYEEGKIAATVGMLNVDFNRGDYTSCINTALPLLQNKSIENPGYHYANLNLATGNCYGSLGLYSKGLEYYFVARTIFEEIGEKIKLTTISNNIGAFYIRLKEYESALEVFNNMSNVSEGSPNEYTIQVNLGFIHLGLKNYEKAETFLKKALEMEDTSIGIRVKAIATYNLGNLHHEIKEFDEALKYYDLSLGYYAQLNNNAQTINPLIGIAKTYLSINEYTKAKEIAKKAVEVGEENKILLELTNATSLLSTVYEKLGDFENAYNYSKKNIELTDSLNVHKRNQEMELMETEYKFKRREEELKQQQQQELQQQSFIVKSVGAGLFLSLLIVLLIYRSNVRQDKANRRLEKLNKELKETNKIKNQLFSIIAHDLRKPLSNLYGMVTLLEMDSANQNQIKKLIPQLVTQFKQTSNLVNNLLNWAKSQMEGYKVIPENFNIHTLIDDNIKLLQSKFDEKKISISQNYNDNDIVIADKNMINLVVLNLLSNALKFCDENDSVTVITSTNKNTLTIEVKDTGVGIPSDKISQLFNHSFYSTSGTRKENGTGLGLLLCKDFVEKNNGTIRAESTQGVGTSIFFTLPLAN